MITFYPRDIELWRSCPEFDLTQRGDILLAVKTKQDYKVFYNRVELIQFLKDFGKVRLSEGRTLEFTGPHEHHVLGTVYNVTHWTLLGWMKDDYR